MDITIDLRKSLQTTRNSNTDKKLVERRANSSSRKRNLSKPRSGESSPSRVKNLAKFKNPSKGVARRSICLEMTDADDE